MSSVDASRLLREDLLAGSAILLARAAATGTRTGSYAATVQERCSELGASVAVCTVEDAAEEDADAATERALQAPLEALGELDMLVVDGAELLAAGRVTGADAAGDDAAVERAALMDCLQASWNLTRAVANAAFLARPQEGGEGRGGRIVYLAPACAPKRASASGGAEAGVYAEAARAGLENLARTLSIEWARFGITLVTVAPGTDTSAGDVAELTAYLASPAGAYFSGCLLDLRGPGGR